MFRRLNRLLQGRNSGRSGAPLRSRRSRAILLESLESRTLLSSVPTGAVEVLNTSTISGWVFNADDGANALNVVITVDGNATTVTANLARPDLLSKLGSANHGFNFSMPGLATGVHTVTVDLQDPFIDFTKRFKTASLTIAAPTGAVEVLNRNIISGWAFSAANGGAPVQVVVTLDGNPTTLTANQSRADLANKLGSPNHAFSFSVPDLITGTHTLTVDVIDPSTSAVKRLRTGTIVIGAPTGTVEVFSSTKISGWAFSGANGGAPNDIILTINGNQYSVTADNARPDLVKKVGSADHAFCFNLPALNPGANAVTVDVVDGSTGQLRRIKSGIVMVGGPVGGVNVFTTNTISGWAFSPLEGGAPINAVITINGVETTLIANANRPDLVAKYGSAYHGFTFTVPTLPPGNNTVTVDVVDPFTGQKTRIKSALLVNRPPVGAVDTFTATRLAGWVYDPDISGPIQVQIKVDGVALGDPFTAGDPHKIKAGTAIGFDVAGDFAGKVVEVFAYDQPSGQVVLIWTNNHMPKGAITSGTPLNVSGWAVDPDAPNTPLTVRIDIDGVTLTTTTADIARSDVQAKAGALNVGFSVDIPGLTPGTHTVTVYALDQQSADAAPVLLGFKIINNAAPVGAVEVADANTVSGWALDPDLGPDATTVNVYIDDTLFGTTTANLPRPDLTAHYGSPNHGFSMDLSSLPEGSHSITVTAIDNRTSNQPEVVIFDSFIDNHAPVGVIEQLTGQTLTGWAYDQDAASTPIPVDIYLDGVYATTVIASQADNNAPTANHGFIVNLPSMSFGTHKIDVYASESQGNVSVLIGSQTVVNQRPIGVIESATATSITGWAADPDRLGESVQIQVFVNGVLAATGTADGERSDLLTLTPLNALPSYSSYGFSLTLPTLPAGSNLIDVYAVDLNNGQISSLGSLTLQV